MSSVVDLLNSLGTGATFKELSGGKLKEVTIPVPPLHEQQRIVGILDEAFEGIATANANAEKNLQNARALFESHLQSVFTQRGERWVETKLNDVTDLITCGVAKRPEYVASGIPFLSARNVKNGQVIWSGYQYVSEESHRALTKHNKPQQGDILYTRVGSYGEAAIIDREIEFSIFVSLTLIKPKKVLLNSFLKYYLNSSTVKQLAAASINGVGVGNLNVGTVREFPIHLPSLSEQRKIVNRLDILREETQRLEAIYQQKLVALDELKKSLLYQAFTRQL
jgi:type I restriction enzyme, S subunit